MGDSKDQAEESKIFENASEKVLMDPYNYIIQLPGKLVRNKLARAFNHWLAVDTDKLEIIAEATQMLHNASLLIDDIEDSSLLRRGKPVAHSIFGIPHTINSANYIYFLCMKQILSLNHPDATTIYTEQLLDLHRGQSMDIYWRDAGICPTEEQYKQMVLRKTGGLFGFAVRLMQLFSTCKTDFRPLYDMLGLYFQIRDDYANLTSKEYDNNKGYCEDLTEGKFSFPIIHGIRKDSSTQIMSILRQKTTNVDVKRYCIQHLDSIGSFEYTRQYLIQLENEIKVEIGRHTDNPYLTALINELCKVYHEQE